MVKAQRILAGLRDGWLILGLSLLLFLLLEGAYRLESGLRLQLSAETPPSESPLHPYAHEPWWHGWFDQAVFKSSHAYDPYRGWWKKPYASPSFNVDSAGRRVTVQAGGGGPTHARILMLGGSTMWGFTSRDSFTIPSLLAAELSRRGVSGVEVVNLAQSSFNFTQEFITLSLELRRGEVPAVAVFLNGHNDAAAAFMQGRAGAALNETVYADILERHSRSFGQSVMALGGYSRLIARIRRGVTQAPPAPPRPEPDALCREVARLYLGTVRSVEALARGEGFSALFLRQPLLATTTKQLSRWERSVPTPPYAEYLARCAALVDSAMGDRLGREYLPLDPLFATDTESVFLDNNGHVTERANAVIAQRIADFVVPLLRSGPATLRTTGEPNRE